MLKNQEVINAVYSAADQLDINGWALLAKAKLTHLVRDRQGLYTDAPIDAIDTLTEEEKALIQAGLPSLPPPPVRKPLQGKGFFIWQVSNCEDGEAESIAAKAREASLTHVLIKIADGETPYNRNIGLTLDRVAPLVAALRAIPDFQVWGWQYTYGKQPEDEARIAVNLVRQYDLDGFVINAEKEYKRDEIRPNAARYAQALRQNLQDADLGNLPVALSSYRFPEVHRSFPWASFTEVCTMMMPQVYWLSQSNPDPVANLNRCLQEYRNMGWTGPIVPTGTAYDESQGSWYWRTKAEEIRVFLPAVKEAGLKAVNFWSWQHAGPERWQPVAEFEW